VAAFGVLCALMIALLTYPKRAEESPAPCPGPWTALGTVRIGPTRMDESESVKAGSNTKSIGRRQ
jgi:hypothetical protein